MFFQIVEDDEALNQGIRMTLSEPDIYFIQSYSVQEAKRAFDLLTELVILDINLPDGNGLDYLKWLRERSNVPVLILTANDLEMDEVMGLETGADDYMTKPFSLAVLRARVHALLRRKEAGRETVKQRSFKEGEYLFDFDTQQFQKGSEKINLSLSEQKVLQCLLEHKEKLATRELLIDRVWSDEGEYVDENALSVVMNRLRGKLGDGRDGSPYIQTVYGQGYMWKA